MRNQNDSIQRRNNCKWTAEEDARLVRQVKAFPQNMHKCFVIVGEEIGRTEKAVAAHWYQKVSKDPANLCFFTASSKHIARNRKNSMGVEVNNSIWQRLLAVIRSIV